jgi:membrane protease YdiL (CAAX protease family)
MSESESQSRQASRQRPTASPEFATALQPSYAQTLFLDANGLRPGWGLAFYIIAFLFLQKLVVDLAWAHDLGSSGLWSMMLEELGNFVADAIPALVLARIEKRRWGIYGLPLNPRFGKLFAEGVAWGFVGISVLIFALYGARTFHFGHILLHGVRVARFAAFWAAMFLLVGLLEEFLFRGYTLFTLARGVRFWPAAIVLSATFGLIHLRNGGEQWAGALAAAAIGFFFCFTLRRTGNLWFAVGFHAAWDWGETFFYSVPDSGTMSPGHLLSSSLRGPTWLSGGSVGPEGSVLCFVVIALAWIAFDRVYPTHNARPMPLQATPGSSSLRSSE